MDAIGAAARRSTPVAPGRPRLPQPDAGSPDAAYVSAINPPDAVEPRGPRDRTVCWRADERNPGRPRKQVSDCIHRPGPSRSKPGCPSSIARLVFSINQPICNPANGNAGWTEDEAKTALIAFRYAAPPRPTTREYRFSRRCSTCLQSVSVPIGRVRGLVKATSYGPGISNSGLTKPCLALRTTQASPKHSAYVRLSLNNALVYASEAGVGPRSGCLSHRER